MWDQDTFYTGTFWGVFNVSHRASDAQPGLEEVLIFRDRQANRHLPIIYGSEDFRFSQSNAMRLERVKLNKNVTLFHYSQGVPTQLLSKHLKGQ